MFELDDHGSIVLVRPLTDDVRAWLDEHVEEDAQWWAGALAVQHSYAVPLVTALLDEGFAIA